MNNNQNKQAGKGDTYRPVNKRIYDENYDYIFRRNKNVDISKKSDSIKQ